MPRPEINDYTFYKIVNVNGDCEMCYVGSSCNMKHRRRTHKNSCNNPNAKEYNYKVYKTIREHGGWCEFQIVELGTAEQLTLVESRIIEERYRIELKASMNTNRCSITKDGIKERNKQYAVDNADKMKEWRVNNFERKQEYDKKYQTENAERIKAYNREKYDCVCGGKYTYNNKTNHINTTIHQNYLSKFKPEAEEVDGQE